MGGDGLGMIQILYMYYAIDSHYYYTSSTTGHQVIRSCRLGTLAPEHQRIMVQSARQHPLVEEPGACMHGVLGHSTV